jgi:hypothetical protein
MSNAQAAAPLPERPVWRWRLLALLLILGAGMLRLLHLASNCQLDLAPDEAHYWDWSRHLDWSYYSKGPLVAWLIRLGCLLAGRWSSTLTGNEMLAVRLPAVVCGSLLLVSLYVLTARVWRSEGLATAVVALSLTMPLIAAGSTLMTIDSPYCCLWGWALVLGHLALFRKSAWAWPATGLLVGLGILAKYTMVLWVPSLGLFLLTTPRYRRLLLRPGPWVLAGVGALCCLPILIWNVQHNWVTLRHLSGLAGVTEESSGIRWLGPIVFVGTQMALLLVVWFLAWAQAMWAYAPWKEARAEVRYLWWMSAVMFGVFFLFGLKTGGGEANWPVTAYLSGMVLTAGWLRDQLRAAPAWNRRLVVGSSTVACGVGLALLFFLYAPTVTQPLLARLVGPPTAERPMPLRRLDPTCRLRGWRALAEQVDQLRALLRQEGIEPVLAGSMWNEPGELGFYCAGHPVVYSLGPALGDRHSQYDLWRPNPIADQEKFVGKTFIFVGGVGESLREAFTNVQPSQEVIYREGEQAIAGWTVTVCRGFKGFPQFTGGMRSY